MLKNHLKVALRNILKHKFYSVINISGLAVGIATCLLILLFVQNELNYDKFHENSDRIYRIVTDFEMGGKPYKRAAVSPPVGFTMANDYPEVETVVRLRSGGTLFMRYEENSFKESEVLYADSTFFKVFTILLTNGNPETALTKPNTMVISKKMAEKYFGKKDPIGKVLRVDDKDDFQVSGTYDRIPANSHFHAEFILSLASLPGSLNPSWLRDITYKTYLLLKESADFRTLEAKFPAMVKKYIGPELQTRLGKSLEEFEEGGGKTGYYLQPLTDIHLYSHLPVELQPNGDIKYVIIFSAIAFFILIIACINFMNLSTARSAKRAKEVGIKKVLWSEKKMLVGQFLTESLLMSVIATIFALFIIQLALPYFNNLAGKELEISYFSNKQLLLGIFFITLFIGVLAGSYPAFFISAFKPIEVLKGKLKLGTKSGLLRSSLVVFQFAASIIMIICTTVVFKQLNYIQNKKLGFTKEQVLIINDAFILGDQVQSFKGEVVKNSSVLSGTVSGYLPTESDRRSKGIFKDGVLDVKSATQMQRWGIDYDYINTLGMEIIKGRNFSRGFGSDSMSVIINESAAKFFEWDDPLGQILGYLETNKKDQVKKFNVIGVVKNFHYESLRNSIEPLLLFLDKSDSKVAFKVNSANISQLVSFIKEKWNEFVPGQPFDYSFMDDEFNDIYNAEKRIGEIFSIFALLAILIGCLGLFGLAAFTAEQRTKEIGIRKVLGASVRGIVFLLSIEFAKLVGIAFLLSIPVSYYYMNEWLQEFHYRTELGLFTFIFAGALAILIAMITVSYHALKIASTNPSKSLRYE